MSDEEDESASEGFSASEDEWKPGKDARGGESSDDDDSDFEEVPVGGAAATGAGASGRLSAGAGKKSEQKPPSGIKGASVKKRKPSGQSLRSKLYNRYRPPPKTFPTSPSQNSPSASSSNRVTASKNARTPNESERNADDSSSESSVENYLVDPAQIDLQSSFFTGQPQPAKESSPAPQFDCNAGITNLSDSGSEDNNESSIEDNKAFDFRTLLENANSLERAKDALAKRASLNATTGGLATNAAMDVNALLALGENQNYATNEPPAQLEEEQEDEEEEPVAPSRLTKTKSTRIKRHTKTRPVSTVGPGGDTDDSDWEEVADVNQSSEGDADATPNVSGDLEIHVGQVLQHRTKEQKTQHELELALKRRVNRNIKDRQLLLHKVSLMCSLARSYKYNRMLSDSSLLEAALKLLPSKNAYPTERGTELKYLQSFVTWFKTAVKLNSPNLYPDVTAKQERGIVEELLSQIKKKQARCKQDMIFIFIILARGMGMNCRLIVNIQPMPLRPAASDLLPIKLKQDDAKAGKKNVSKADESENEEDDDADDEVDKKISKAKQKPTKIVEVKSKDKAQPKSSSSRAAAKEKDDAKPSGSSKPKEKKEDVKPKPKTELKEVAKPASSRIAHKKVEPQSSLDDKPSTSRSRQGAAASQANGRSKSLETKPKMEILTKIEDKRVRKPAESKPKLHKLKSKEDSDDDFEPSTQVKKAKTSPESKLKPQTSLEEKPSSSRSRNKAVIKQASSESDAKPKLHKLYNKGDSDDNFAASQESKAKPKLARLKRTTTLKEASTEVDEKKPKLERQARQIEVGKKGDVAEYPAIKIGSPVIPKLVVHSKRAQQSAKSNEATVNPSQRQRDTRTRSKSPKVHISTAFLQGHHHEKEPKALSAERSPKERRLSQDAKAKISPQFLKEPADSLAPVRQLRTRQQRTNANANSRLGIPQLDGADDSPVGPAPKKRPKLEKLHKSRSKGDSDEDFEPPAAQPVKKSPMLPKAVLHLRRDRRVLSTDDEGGSKNNRKATAADMWVEMWSELEEQWICVDLFKGKLHCVDTIRRNASPNLAYVFAFQDDLSLKDVTARYCPSWTTTVRKGRVEKAWLDETITPYLGRRTKRDILEDQQLRRIHEAKPMPKSISEFKDHPLYALERHLLKFQGLYPPDTPTLGFIRGEAIYARDCVHLLHSREIWLKSARTVKLGEQPYKIVKARPKWDKLTRTVIKDQPLEIFGYWQTQDFEPPTAENGIVPRNAYGNVELFKACMLPKKTVHLRLPGLMRVCKKLNIDCANAVIGFDFHQGACHPMMDGFVICEEFKDIVTDAWHQDQHEQARKEQEKYEARVYGNWKKLIKGLFIRERLQKKYNFGKTNV